MGARTHIGKRRQRAIAAPKPGQRIVNDAVVGDLLERTGLRAAAAGIQAGYADCVLLRLCAEFHDIAADVRATEDQLTAAADDEAERLWRVCGRTLWRDYDAIVDRIIGCSSRTVEGLHAKGLVLRAVLVLSASAGNGQPVEPTAPHERLAQSLLDDVLGTDPDAPRPGPADNRRSL